VPAALAITRFEFPGRDFLNGLFLSPIIIPHLVLGVALLRLFALMGVNGSFAWLIFAHVLVITPYVLRLCWRRPSAWIAAPNTPRNRSVPGASRCSGKSPCR
jgi:ABC-type spermidine/putrescine transport system, permease component II